MGSGTNISGCGRQRRRCGGRASSSSSSSATASALVEDCRRVQATSSFSAVEDVVFDSSSSPVIEKRTHEEQQHRLECCPQLAQREEVISGSRHVVARRTRTTIGGSGLLITITLLLFILQCDMATLFVGAASSSPDHSGAASRSLVSATMVEDSVARNSPVQHISQIYKANSVLRSAPEDKEEGSQFSDRDLQRIQDLVLRGLNITRIPRASEINISQKEYEEKYRLYLERLNQAATRRGGRHSRGVMSSPHDETEEHAAAADPLAADDETDLLHFHTFRSNSSSNSHRSKRSTGQHKDLVFVRFPLPQDDKLSLGVEEATLRVMLTRHPNHQNHRHHHHLRASMKENKVFIHVYQLSGVGERIMLDSTEVEVNSIGERGKWIEFNVRAAVNSWIEEDRSNLGFEVHCDNCDQQGIQVVHEQNSASTDFYGQGEDEDAYDDELLKPPGHGDDNSPALNIVSRARSPRGKRSRMIKPYANRPHSRKPHHTKCEEHNGQKCCRSEMNVVFRDLKPLDFIIQPKSFDAGYCRGKCPFNYNVASHHAYLQGMIWRQDRKKVPRPCCAPKKLEDLQILHIDEDDPTKLKVSTWSEMRVLECACS